MNILSSFTTCIFGTDEFIENLLGKDFIDTKSKKDMTKALEVSLKKLRAARMLGGASAVPPPSGVAVDVKHLTDEEFMVRQHVRKVFGYVDTDKSGFIDKAELRRLLRTMGVKVMDEELDALFNLIDNQERDGHISFEEFYSWYLTGTYADE